MPRKPLPISHLFPYHVLARANNQDWFYLELDECWQVFCSVFNTASLRFQLQIHAFVLMSNHYHLIATTSEQYPLPKVMEWVQRSANRIIHQQSGRTNHLFGGPYKASLITKEAYYFNALKYVYRNPITAGITPTIESYSYTTLSRQGLSLTTPITGIESLVPKRRKELIRTFNEDFSDGAYQAVHHALQKKHCKLRSQLSKKMKLELHCCDKS